jgi:hypothetical protein
MDESGSAIEISYKSRVIVPAKEKKVRKIINSKREWVTNCNTINSVGKISTKGFYITKGKRVFRDLIKLIVESGCTLAVTDNEWSNNFMVL